MFERVAQINIERYNIVATRPTERELKSLAESKIHDVVQHLDVVTACGKRFRNRAGPVRTAVVDKYQLPSVSIFQGVHVTAESPQVLLQDAGLVICGHHKRDKRLVGLLLWTSPFALEQFQLSLE